MQELEVGVESRGGVTEQNKAAISVATPRGKQWARDVLGQTLERERKRERERES